MAEESTQGGGSGSSGNEEDRILGAAPSSPDIRKLQLLEPSEKAKAHEPSKVDAMGQDKRRMVVGHSYGPSRRSQIIFFVIIGAILVVALGGWSLAVAAFDQPPDSNPDKAPWSTSETPLAPTRSPAGPCGEPGNPYPPPADSPCATSVSSTGEPPLKGASTGRPEEGSGGAVAGGSESEQGGQ